MQCSVHEVTEGDGTEYGNKCMCHGHRGHGLYNVHIDRLPEFLQACRPSEVSGCRVNSLDKNREDTAQNDREDRVNLHSHESPGNSGAETAPEPVCRGFTGNRLVEDAVQETHLRSELDL